MVPSFLVEVERWPLTINGKTDRRALPHPEDHADGTNRAYTAPRDTTEARLAAVWQEVLGVDRVGIDDSYYDLGGDSLQASGSSARCAATASRYLCTSCSGRRPSAR